MDITNEIRTVQDGTVEGIKNLGELVANIALTLSKEKQIEYNQLKSALDNEVTKIKRLELTTAVVAPMKSGKSTIINAIVGQELLPTRNAAMTTFPTEVVLRPDVEFARLLLPNQIVLACQEIINNIILKINNDPNERCKVTDIVPHLEETISNILSGDLGSRIQKEISGNKEIVEVLILLNEIIRISGYLNVSLESINRVSELPRIEAPYIKGINRNEGLGNLIIIDTPGPNEAGQEHLGLIVQNQLQRCSVVMIVLNYRQINSNAEEDIRNEVEKIINLRGKENLFVLVNQIDARGGDKDMTVSDILKYVKNLFKFEDANYHDRVFEISASRAFAASNCLLEISKKNPFEISREAPYDNPLINLLRISESKWETRIKKMSKDDLVKSVLSVSREEFQEKISDTWELSNFSPFLDKAIAKLLADAAPISIRSAINQCMGLIARINDDAALRNSGLDKEVQEIIIQIGELSIDLDSVLKKRLELNVVETIKSNLIVEILKIRKNVDFTFPISVKNVFENQKTVVFTSDTNASEFIKKAESLAIIEVKGRITNYQLEVKRKLSEGQKSILDIISSNIQPIVEQVKLRMQKTFNVNISLKEPNTNDLLLQDEGLAAISPNRKSKIYSEKIEKYKTVRKEVFGLRNWFNETFGTRISIDTEQIHDGFETVQREFVSFEVSLLDLEKAFSDSMKTNIQKIEDLAEIFIQEHVNVQVKNYFDDVDDYLESYRKTLRQMEDDKKMSEQEKKELKIQLNYIQQSTITEKGKLSEIETKLKQLFPNL